MRLSSSAKLTSDDEAEAAEEEAEAATARPLRTAPTPLTLTAEALGFAARREVVPSSPVGTNDGPQSHPKSEAGLRTKLLRECRHKDE